jgi:hypothetical protein
VQTAWREGWFVSAIRTLDKLHGREAPVVFSMATSSGDDLPPNLEFLFSSRKLLEIRCRTIDKCGWSSVCFFVEEAER